MAWHKIKRIENSKYNTHSKVVIFEDGERENYVVITKKVLQYINVKNLRVGDLIYTIWSKNEKYPKGRYLLKNAKRN
jgi:hypothetical protein